MQTGGRARGAHRVHTVDSYTLGTYGRATVVTSRGMSNRSRPELSARQLTYDRKGVSVAGPAPSGTTTYATTRLVGVGQDVWTAASRAVLNWEVKTRSGFTVEGADLRSVSTVRRGRFWLVAHIGPLRIYEPIEVVSLIEESNRVGYAYGTLEGHPVTGEESFIIDRRTDASVWLTIHS
ncbi:MAG: hypothetical protein QOG90_1633, partial [Actinomycetota bacterium]